MSPSASSPLLSDTANAQSSADQFGRDRKNSNVVFVDENGFCLLASDAILRILNIHAEAIIRCVELEDAQES
ncbi:hypothetical protein G6F62_013539 [Rhizopus arrhizus]|nr:hypothetical protein G6F22_016770 [Rhizopus arrhizus]KAG0925192.1 hypothetical protein G6F32_013644 [Rhizopus arrhizus]KAG0932176.1 hypothetical protein G6F31_016600 [Rhizopus arrhizus]KAG1149277.1 hypothetical protein G6F36_014733 [Rhizopus arrhizus]KAG1316384.1 hypothetical protein G6F62_013539 [Rhizopus arrhizus]